MGRQHLLEIEIGVYHPDPPPLEPGGVAATATGGIFKDAPPPNATKLHPSWFLAKEEQQARLGSFSSRADVPPDGLRP